MTTHPLELPFRDIHLPDAISWWPLAPGWWALVGLIILLSLTLFLLKLFVNRPQLKKDALQALDRIEKNLNGKQTAVKCLADVSVLLRRVMLKKYSSSLPALTGESWLKTLDKTLKEPEFSQGIGQILLTGPYRKEVAQEDVFQVIQLCRKWIKCL